MILSGLKGKAAHLLADNATTLLTTGGVVGTITTAVLTAKASFKAAEEISDNSYEQVEDTDRVKIVSLSKTDKVKIAAPFFIPPMITGSATIAAIIFAHRMSAQKAAALAAAYGISQNQRDEYKTKLEEKLGIKKAETARDEIQQDRVDENPPSQQVVIVGNGDVMFYDAFSGRYFMSTMEKVRKAEAVVNNLILSSNECSLDAFYEEVGLLPIGSRGLEEVPFARDMGWNLQHPCKVEFTALISEEDKPVMAFEFKELPIFEYGSQY